MPKAMSIRRAREVKRPSIRVGRSYEFYSTMQEGLDPPAERIRNYTGQRVRVIVQAFKPGDEHWIPGESERGYTVRADDGREFYAIKCELDGWIKDTGQFFWPDGTYGWTHDRRFLVNDRYKEEPDERAALQQLGGLL